MFTELGRTPAQVALNWVRQGSPTLGPADSAPRRPAELIAVRKKRPRPQPNLIYRVSDTGGSRRTPADRLASSGNWHAPGKQAPPTAGGHLPNAATTPTPHQAVRQQPPQRPRQTILR